MYIRSHIFCWAYCVLTSAKNQGLALGFYIHGYRTNYEFPIAFLNALRVGKAALELLEQHTEITVLFTGDAPGGIDLLGQDAQQP